MLLKLKNQDQLDEKRACVGTHEADESGKMHCLFVCLFENCHRMDSQKPHQGQPWTAYIGVRLLIIAWDSD
jgi:hypothetical protein